MWVRVGWSDELSAYAGHGEVYVTRRAKEVLHPDCMIPIFKEYSSCMMWSMISIHEKGPLVIFEKSWCTNLKGTVGSGVYTKYILPHISAFQESYRRRAAEVRAGAGAGLGAGGDFIYMEDNSAIHSSKLTTAAYQALGISRAWWPANSPDLNPIENVWQLLKWRLAKRFPKTNAEVRQYLQEEWEKIEVEGSLLGSYTGRGRPY